VPQLRYETHVVWKDEMDAMKWGLSSAIASNVEVLSRAIQTYNEKKANGVVVDATRPVSYEEWLHPGLAACVVVYWLLCLGLVWSLLAFITSSFVEPSNYRPRAGRT
jgi:hypothetical protein